MCGVGDSIRRAASDSEGQLARGSAVKQQAFTEGQLLRCPLFHVRTTALLVHGRPMHSAGPMRQAPLVIFNEPRGRFLVLARWLHKRADGSGRQTNGRQAAAWTRWYLDLGRSDGLKLCVKTGRVLMIHLASASAEGGRSRDG